MITRERTRVRMGGGRFRYRIVIANGNTGLIDSLESRKSLAELTEMVSTQPELWRGTSSPPTEYNIRFNDGVWSVESVTVVVEGD